MEINKDHIEKRLRDEFDPTYLQVEDFSSSCGLKFDAILVSKKFEGKALLARQRMVNDILKDEMTQIHAFTQKTYTPQEWEKKQQKPSEAEAKPTCAGLCGNSKSS